MRRAFVVLLLWTVAAGAATVGKALPLVRLLKEAFPRP